MEPWAMVLTLPPPPVVAFEAKWGVNKSNIHPIVRHPEGPSEVTLEVQITLGHGLLTFAPFPISSQFLHWKCHPVPHSYNHTGLFTFVHLGWLNGPFLGIVPPKVCLMFRQETTMQRANDPYYCFFKSCSPRHWLIHWLCYPSVLSLEENVHKDIIQITSNWQFGLVL